METLYSDALQFLYHFALAFIVGGGIALGAVVAPALFRKVPSRSEAGLVFGEILAGWDALAIVCVVVLVVTSALKAGAYEVNGAPEGRLVARWVALALLSASVLYASGWASPVARSIRKQTRDFDDLPPSAPARIEFAKLHRSASGAMRIAILAGAVAMLLS